jgi:hypothetical protein
VWVAASLTDTDGQCSSLRVFVLQAGFGFGQAVLFL